MFTSLNVACVQLPPPLRKMRLQKLISRTVELIDEIRTKRIHIQEEMKKLCGLLVLK